MNRSEMNNSSGRGRGRRRSWPRRAAGPAAIALMGLLGNGMAHWAWVANRGIAVPQTRGEPG